MAQSIRATVIRPALRLLALPLLLLTAATGAPAAATAAAGLSIELNRLEPGSANCLANLLVRNDIGETLDRFSLDLHVFDKEGIAQSRFLIDMAPLPASRTTPFSFFLGRSCEDIGRLLIADVPACRTQSGENVDCLAGLRTRSRTDIDLDR